MRSGIQKRKPYNETMGQPTKLDKPLILPNGTETTVGEEIIRIASSGAKKGMIADCVGIHVETLTNWLRWGNPRWQPTSESDKRELPKNREVYFQFFRDYTEAQGRIATAIQASWAKAAKDGDWRASKEWLRSHRPEEFNEEVTIKHQGKIEVDHTLQSILEEYAGAFESEDEDDTEATE